ncbi:MAG: nitrite/sulfite reductase [Trichloromonas sp.]|jgi:sulfite reductase beta subunit-like hemoprotein|nr:nitrite/sulfite reductase [Trichloromonas sp.]
MTGTTEIDYQQLRLDGIYRQNEAGELMLRVKIPAGVFSAEQARKIGGLAERFAGSELHLTTRGSIELHGLRYEDLAPLAVGLAAVGLTSRGACGGAVRGIACGTSFAPGFPEAQALARRLHRHFTGNPHFEGLPKKFKIGIDAGYPGARHLIQDAGLVQVDAGRYDVWLAGGLGREPRAGFRFADRVDEDRLLPLIEAVVRVYRKHAPAGRRLKFLADRLGEARLRELIRDEQLGAPERFPPPVLERSPLPGPVAAEPVEVPIFAGELTAERLRRLADIAAEHGGGFLAVTGNQNIAFAPADGAARAAIEKALAAEGLTGGASTAEATLRVCPGSHLCRMGLAPTRDLARQVLDVLGPEGQKLSWAISGCPNSCAQAQLADAGILATHSVKTADGARQPRFSLLRRTDAGLGRAVAENLDLDGLLLAVRSQG